MDDLPTDTSRSFLNAMLHSADRAIVSRRAPPETELARARLADRWLEAVGSEPPQASPPAVLRLATLPREGYDIELLRIETLPDVWMTAHAYVPKSAGRHPAVLCVHGHWPWARRDPVVQSRCQGLVQQGFVVLAVDALGAGERAIKPGKGAYHGALLGAMTWPTGQTLCGLQFTENRRAVDYLVSRPDVDPDRLGVTGASGGGNQSMYLGTFDDRLKAVVPVCSVGSFRAYLGAACCVCEVVPGALAFAEESDLFAAIAPRALLVISAQRDAPQFAPAAAAESVARARDAYEKLSASDRLRHDVIDSGHDYSQAMRERMYGWMRQWLMNVGDGSPFPEPPIAPEPVEHLSCLDHQAPARCLLLPDVAHRTAERMLAKFAPPADRSQLEALQELTKHRLRRLLSVRDNSSYKSSLEKATTVDGVVRQRGRIWADKDVSLRVQLAHREKVAQHREIAILLTQNGIDDDASAKVASRLLMEDVLVVTFDLRATGVNKPPSDSIADAADHNSSEWALWVGRPLLGQWVEDVQSVITLAVNLRISQSPSVRLHSFGPMNVLALVTALLSAFVKSVECHHGLLSLKSATPYSNVPMALLAPKLFQAGDVDQFAGLLAPRGLRWHGGVLPNGSTATAKDLSNSLTFTTAAYALVGALSALDLRPS